MVGPETCSDPLTDCFGTVLIRPGGGLPAGTLTVRPYLEDPLSEVAAVGTVALAEVVRGPCWVPGRVLEALDLP